MSPSRPRPGGRRRSRDRDLTVAVTGPTGTLGAGLVPLLQADDRITRVIGMARRPFDPGGHGWTKMEYRQGDFRDPDALREASIWMQGFGQFEPVNLDAFEAFLRQELAALSEPAARGEAEG